MALNGLSRDRHDLSRCHIPGGSARHQQVDTTSQWPCGTIPDSADLEVDSHHIPLGSTGLSGMILQMKNFILSHKQQRVDFQRQFFSQMCAEGLPVTSQPRLNTGVPIDPKEMCQSFWATAIAADQCFNHLDDLRDYPPAWSCSHQFGHVDMLLVPEHAGRLKNGRATTIDSDNQKWDDVTICRQKHAYIHTIHYITRLYLHLHLHLHLLHYIHVYIYIYSIYNYVYTYTAQNECHRAWLREHSKTLAWYSMSSADRYLAASTRCLIGSQGKLKHNNHQQSG